MSHTRERTEKDCLNCGTQVQGRFCHVCGQENVETRESFWSLTTHFVYDILHFDGKFFSTLRELFRRPGLAARRYAEGKRMSYLHPIRMYLFTSAVFFLVFFTFGGFNVTSANWSEELDSRERDSLTKAYRGKLKGEPRDTVYRERIAMLEDTIGRPVLSRDSLFGNYNRTVSFGGKSYGSVAEYETAQAASPAAERDGWFMRRLTVQSIYINHKYRGRQGAQAFANLLVHKAPYLLFVSLPFFAGLLKLLYVRRKNFFYSDHAVFTLYHYVFTFLLLLAIFAFDALHDWSGWGIFEWMEVLLGLLWPVYLFLEMKNFYRQSWPKTLGKFVLLNVLGFVVILILFLLFFFLSIFQA